MGSDTDEWNDPPMGEEQAEAPPLPFVAGGTLTLGLSIWFAYVGAVWPSLGAAALLVALLVGTQATIAYAMRGER